MIFEFAMFFLSFLPLWLSIIFMDLINMIRDSKNLWTEKLSVVGVLSGIIICSFVTWKWLHKDGSQNREKYEIISAKEERFITAEFMMTYVLPLFAFDFTRWDGVVLFLLFFYVFWFLVHRHKYFCTNLALEIFGYRIYECELKNGNQTLSKLVVSRNELNAMAGSTIRTRKYNNDYHFEVIEKSGEEQ